MGGVQEKEDSAIFSLRPRVSDIENGVAFLDFFKNRYDNPIETFNFCNCVVLEAPYVPPIESPGDYRIRYYANFGGEDEEGSSSLGLILPGSCLMLTLGDREGFTFQDSSFSGRPPEIYSFQREHFNLFRFVLRQEMRSIGF